MQDGAGFTRKDVAESHDVSPVLMDQRFTYILLGNSRDDGRARVAKTDMRVKAWFTSTTFLRTKWDASPQVPQEFTGYVAGLERADGDITLFTLKAGP